MIVLKKKLPYSWIQPIQTMSTHPVLQKARLQTFLDVWSILFLKKLEFKSLLKNWTSTFPKCSVATCTAFRNKLCPLQLLVICLVTWAICTHVKRALVMLESFVVFYMSVIVSRIFGECYTEWDSQSMLVSWTHTSFCMSWCFYFDHLGLTFQLSISWFRLYLF